jgi:hypothetical protein
VSYFVIENFNRGLDVRRHIMNLAPGCLFRGKNINISRGGEPETAKAFVLKGAFPPDTYGLLSAGGKLWTFGSGLYTDNDMPGGVRYQVLQIDSTSGITGVIWATPIKGKPFVIASFSGGYGVFFNGVLIDDFKSILPAGGTMADIAANFAAQINSSATFVAGAVGNVVTIQGRPNVNFSIATTAINGGGVNDQSAVAAVTQNPSAPAVEVLATGTITFSGVNPTWSDDLGQWVPTQFIDALTINGVEQLGRTLVASDDVGAAASVAAYCNSYSAVPDYVAVASGSNVTFTAGAGTGAGPNGYSILPGSPNAAGSVMAGGVSPGSGLPKICTVTFNGTYEVADTFSITLDGQVFTLGGGASGSNPVAGQRPTMALTKNDKTYAIAGPNLLGSKIGDCTDWAGTGSFVTDMSTEIAGADALTAIAYFQGNLAIFSRSTVQVEFVDPDPALNEQVQTLQNIGTLAPHSVTSFGDSDVFFLSDTGVRSLKVRAATDSATVSDIGSPIDPLIIAAIKASVATAQKACGAIEPVDGRFMLQIGTTTYVFSYFPDAKIAAWTTYETGLSLTEFAVLETRLYARDVGNLYLLGGNNNDVYSAQPPDIKIPFVSARQIATLKHFTALDVICDGVFDVSISTDPLHPDAEEVVCTVNGTTLGLGANKIAGEDVTAVALRLVGRPSKYARLSSLVVHHEVLKENAP